MMYHCEKSVLQKCPNAFQRLVVEILYPIYIYLSIYLGIALNAYQLLSFFQQKLFQ